MNLSQDNKNKKIMRVGTRGSLLSITQTNHVIDLLKKIYPHIQFEIIKIKTEGDIKNKAPLSAISGKGVFVKEIEEALLQNKIDFAVHSLKDMLTILPKGLVIACYLKRENPADVILTKKKDFADSILDTLMKGSRIGTSSIRRSAQLLAYRNDLKILSIRGNVDTRIKKLLADDYDAIILAAAGLKRLNIGLSNLRLEEIPFHIMLPSPGQGAIVVETRKGKYEDFFKQLNCFNTELEVRAERSLLQSLGGGCKTPIGTLAIIKSGQLLLKACVCKIDGTELIKGEIYGSYIEPEKIALKLAEELIKKGADRLLKG